MRDIKEVDPVIKEGYYVANNIATRSAFECWTTDTLRRRDRIISKVKARYWKCTHKFDIQRPKTVNKAYKLDEQSLNNVWTYDINK